MSLFLYSVTNAVKCGSLHTKRPFPIEKGVSLCRKEPLLTSKKRPLHLQTIVFTPLSIRRGDGGEAVDGLLVRLVVVVIEASSFPLREVGLGLCPTLILDNPSLIHPHSSLCTMTEYRVLSASSPLQPYQRIHGDYHH